MTDSNQQLDKSNERILVIGGGGARGAWSGGFAKFLVSKNQRPYRYAIGTSTGSLIAPMIVLNDFDTLKTAYTSVTQSDIFNVNPFREDGELRKFRAIWRLLTGKQTFGESQNLRKLIDRFLTREKYEQIINASPERQITICYINFKDGSVGYARSGKEMTWEEMGNWIWGSANEPLFMSFAGEPELKGGFYVDGGVRQNVPITVALDYATKLGINDIDIIVNKPIDSLINKAYEPRGILKNLQRLIELWETEVRNDNIIIADLLSDLHETEPPPIGDHGISSTGTELNLNFHYIPKMLYARYFNELIFDKERMTELWERGEKGEEDTAPVTMRVDSKKVRSLKFKSKQQ